MWQQLDARLNATSTAAATDPRARARMQSLLTEMDAELGQQD
jgi:hypothetical protein